MAPVQPHYLKIFLSSPSDVAQERALALQVIDQLNYDPMLRERVVLRPVAWDKPGAGTPLIATMTPQEAINQGLPKPSECDIVIVIFWSRMGTPLPREYIKADGSRYLSGTEWEYEDAVAAARRSEEQPARPQVIVYRRTEEVVLKPSDPAFMQKYEQWQRVQKFFDSFSDEDGSIRQGYNQYDSPDMFRADLETHLKVLVNQIIQNPLSPALPTPSNSADSFPAWQGSPFPGLRAFTSVDAPIFFGRGRETDGLVNRLADPYCRFLCIVGASGSGKSSLVGAGLLPRLSTNAVEGSKDWEIVRFTPGEVGDDPFLALAAALTHEVAALKTYRPRDLLDTLTTNPTLIEDMVIKALANKPQWSELLLFIDQFEELFTLAAERHRGPFIIMLETAARTARLRIVATIRADFYHRCVEYPELSEILRLGSYPLAAPKTPALFEMITRPAARAGLQFENDLAERILEDTGPGAGALALMAYALDELYSLCKSTVSNQLTFATYEALGGVQGAIGIRAEKVFEALDSDIQSALPTVFRNLVEVDERGIATRQRVRLNQIDNDSNAPALRLIDAFTEARLLVQSTDHENFPTVEVAHEALLQNWPRLAQWIETAQDDLRLLRQVKSAAREWTLNHRRKAFRWADERLRLVSVAIQRLDAQVDEDVREFIQTESERLLAEIDDKYTMHFRRAAIGDRLADIGDVRPGVGLRSDGLPDICWCFIAGGSTPIKGRLFEVPDFYIARYSITYSQFKAFVEDDDGYRNDRWWEGLLRLGEPEPYYPSDNHPVENVSWYDAVAFCRWLKDKFPASGYPKQASRIQLRLPTEWEWQQAATSGGVDANLYPWGRDWHSNFANTNESGLGRTIAVGMYPKGATLEGQVMDMVGNVQEWCLNQFTGMTNTFITSRNEPRVLRGGSWNRDKNEATVIYRDSSKPTKRSNDRGFRIMCLLSGNDEVEE